MATICIYVTCIAHLYIVCTLNYFFSNFWNWIPVFVRPSAPSQIFKGQNSIRYGSVTTYTRIPGLIDLLVIKDSMIQCKQGKNTL